MNVRGWHAVLNEIESGDIFVKFDYMMSLRISMHGFSIFVILYVCFDLMSTGFVVASNHHYR